LWRLAESLDAVPALDQRYQDPQQTATAQPDTLPPELVKQLGRHMEGLKLNFVDTMLPGIASYLSEPKPHAFFSCPDQTLSAKAFAHSLKQSPLYLHPQTRLMRLGNTVFCNGENQTEGQSLAVKLCWNVLSERHTMPALGKENSAYLADIAAGHNSLYEAYCSGWVLMAGKNEESL
jgi:50S ribosomal protein L16 3-hydroxylase